MERLDGAGSAIFLGVAEPVESEAITDVFRVFSNVTGTFLPLSPGGGFSLYGCDLLSASHGACPVRCDRGCAPGCGLDKRPSASCGGAGSRVPRRWRSKAAACRRGTSGP